MERGLLPLLPLSDAEAVAAAIGLLTRQPAVGVRYLPRRSGVNLGLDFEFVPVANGPLTEEPLRQRDRHAEIRGVGMLVRERIEQAEQAVTDHEGIELIGEGFTRAEGRDVAAVRHSLDVERDAAEALRREDGRSERGQRASQSSIGKEYAQDLLSRID